MKKLQLIMLFFLCSACFAAIDGNGSPEEPYLIVDYNSLLWMQNTADMNAHWRLAADVDACDTNSGSGWLPVGINIGSPFSGFFDGNGYTIANLFITSDTISCGFFGVITGGVVRGLGLVSAVVTDSNDGAKVGILAGQVLTGDIGGCYSTGTVSAPGTMPYVGGLIGFIQDGNVYDSYSSAVVTGGGSGVVGGFCGETRTQVSRCYASGNVNNYTAGGFAGGIVTSDGNCNNCYAIGNVNGTQAGGFARAIVDGGWAVNCYSAGAVTATYKGGFVQWVHSYPDHIIQCHYDTDTSGCSDAGYAEVNTTAQMKRRATYAGWDFNSVWLIKENVSYPDFDGVRVNLTVSTSAKGTVQQPGIGIFYYEAGSIVDLNAVVTDGNYVFDFWTGDVADVNAAVTTINLDTNSSVTANFTINSRTLTITSTKGGAILWPETSPAYYQYKELAEIYTEPNDPNYYFVNWTGDAVDAGKVADPNGDYTTIYMDSNYAIVANYESNTPPDTNKVLTVSTSAGGTVTVPGIGQFEYPPSTEVEITAEAADGYHFINWTGTAVSAGKVADPNAISTTALMSSNYTVKANFIPDTMTLTLAVSGNGSTIPTVGAHSYDFNDVVEINAIPDTGWHFVNWTGDIDTVNDVNASFTNILIDGNYSITANFAYTHTCTIDANAGPNCVAWYKCDEDEPLNLINNSVDCSTGTSVRDTCDMHVEGVIDGALYFDGNDYVNCNRTYQSVFRATDSNGFTMTWRAKPNDGQPSTVQNFFGSYDNDNSISCYIDDTGEVWANYTSDEDTVWTTFKDVLPDGVNPWMMITVVVEKISPTAKISLYRDGVFQNSGEDYAEMSDFTTVLNLYLGVMNWGNNTYNYFNGSLDDFRIYNRALEPNEIAALAGKKILTVTATEGGTVQQPGIGEFFYDVDTAVDINAVADSGYIFNVWTGDTATIADVCDPTTTITMDSNYAIEANFVELQVIGECKGRLHNRIINRRDKRL